MNFAHHVPAEQTFTAHTLLAVTIALAIGLVIAGTFFALCHYKQTETEEEEH